MDTSINPKNTRTIPYHFISTLLNANFDFDVSVANDVAIDVAKYTLPVITLPGNAYFINQWKWALHNENITTQCVASPRTPNY